MKMRCLLIQGLGNAFLANIDACDAIFHVISKYNFGRGFHYFSNYYVIA